MGDWLLCYDEQDFSDLQWLFVDGVVRVDPKDQKAYEKGFAFQAFQINPDKMNPTPPFKLDAEFCKAFAKVMSPAAKNAIERDKKNRFPKPLLQRIAKDLGG
jgi:hypothetical protein